MAHVTETRRALELQTAQFAARYASEAQRQTLRELVAQMRSAATDQARRVESDVAIHTVIAEASGNPLNSLLLHALRSPLEAPVRFHFDDRRTEVELIRLIDAHEAIVDRICAGDAVGAASAMPHHFDLSLMQVERREAVSMWCGQPQSGGRTGRRGEARRRAFDDEAHGRIAAPLESLRNRSGQLRHRCVRSTAAGRVHSSINGDA